VHEPEEAEGGDGGRPLFSRVSRSRLVHDWLADQPYDTLAFLDLQAQPHVSRAVVSSALARSVGIRGPRADSLRPLGWRPGSPPGVLDDGRLALSVLGGRVVGL
jgi:hypothetical protein